MTRHPRLLRDAAILAGPGTRRVLALLGADGEEARIVGGAVRNALLGLPPGDIDIATTLVPADVTARAHAAGLRTIPTGVAHGTVTVLAEGESFEVTTLREDIETDGRHAVVRFGRDFAADALRRDFTVNALSAEADGTVWDYTGGLDDLEPLRIRFIGDADQRLREDHLRLLRFFRFHAQYGQGEPDAASFAACVRDVEGLAGLSRERIRQEIWKLLAAPRAAEALEAMAGAGALHRVLGGVPDLARARRLGPADPVMALAALALRVREDVERLRDRLKLSNREADRLEALARLGERWHGAPVMGQHAARMLLVGSGPALFADAVALLAAGGVTDVAAVRDLPSRWDAPRVPWTGEDAMALGLEGRAIGPALRRARKAWMEAGFPADAGTLGQLLQDAVDPLPSGRG